MKEGQGSRRRVSFAEKAEINYITYQKDNSTIMSNSASPENSMDIITELEEFKNLNLFTNEEDTSLIREQYTILEEPDTEILRRQSLDPLKFIAFDTSFENLENNDIKIEKEDIKNQKEQKVKDLASLDDHSVKKESTQSIFWNASIKNDGVKHVQETFDDTGVINSSFGVEELVNTIDLRKIIPQEWKEKQNVAEFLSSQGIRFLDETVINGIKRDTLSKSRNIVDPSMIIYYKYSLSERIEFLYGFSNFLIDKMKDLQREIEEAEQNIDVSLVNKDNLKRIRNEARNKAKFDWYSLRKIYEIQFNKKIIENKNKALDMLNNLKKENIKVQETLFSKQQNVEALKDKIAELKQKALHFEKENVQRAEELQRMITERKRVLESANIELEKVTAKLEEQRSEEGLIQKRIEKVKNSVENLKKNLAIKNVSEYQLSDTRKAVKRYNTIYQFKITGITKNNVTFDICENTISTDVNQVLEVVSFSVLKTCNDPFNEFARSLIQTDKNLKLVQFVRKCADAYYSCLDLRKEINIIKEKAKVECFYLNSFLYIRIYLSGKKEYLDASISNLFDLFLNGSLHNNLKRSPGLLNALPRIE
ncbi:hypothetical protein GINT2_000134 [Glugoides intestinalis]